MTLSVHVDIQLHPYSDYVTVLKLAERQCNKKDSNRIGCPGVILATAAGELAANGLD